jgi:PncC family amidohydrolase
VVAYHDDLKRSLLRVAGEVIVAHGSVSRETVEAMAEGMRAVSGASLGLAMTGIAGPGGATATKPVGLAFVSVTDGERTLTRQHQWDGDRAQNRRQSAHAAMALAAELLAS